MKISEIQIKKFRETIWTHYRAHKRAMPWRTTKNAYRILVSEIMLQQTQVNRVLTKYPEFLKALPNLATLAQAPLSKVLSLWQGLGYNRRALNLKRAAEILTEQYKGKIPQDTEILKTLPGIGPNTAGSIAAFAFNKPVSFIETNIRRTYIHFFLHDKRDIHDNDILELVSRTLDHKDPRNWYYALMDYGSMLGSTLPKQRNPNRRSRHYARQSKFEGSDRELRSRVLKILLAHGPQTRPALIRALDPSMKRSTKILAQLERERFIIERKGRYAVIDS